MYLRPGNLNRPGGRPQTGHIRPREAPLGPRLPPLDRGFAPPESFPLTPREAPAAPRQAGAPWPARGAARASGAFAQLPRAVTGQPRAAGAPPLDPRNPQDQLTWTADASRQLSSIYLSGARPAGGAYDKFLPEVREFITRHTAYNKHDTGWAKGAPSEDHTTPPSLHRLPGPLCSRLFFYSMTYFFWLHVHGLRGTRRAQIFFYVPYEPQASIGKTHGRHSLAQQHALFRTFLV